MKKAALAWAIYRPMRRGFRASVSTGKWKPVSVFDLMLRGFRVNRCQHMAKTYTVFKIVDRSTILDFTLHLVAANAERLSSEYQRPKV